MVTIPIECPQVEVPTGEIVFSFPQGGWEDWGARVAKGAIINALERAKVEVHSDFTGRVDGHDGACMERKAPICYRNRGDKLHVYAWGDRAHEHIDLLARHIRALWVPQREGGERIDDTDKRYAVVPIRVEQLVKRSDIVGLPSKSEMDGGGGWYRYKTASPIWPPKNAKYKRPKPGTDEHFAWMGSVIAGSIRELLAGHGIKGERAHICLLHWKYVPNMRYERDRPGVVEVCDGFHAEFLTNVLIPDGWPVGARGAEGYGEVRHVNPI